MKVVVPKEYINLSYLFSKNVTRTTNYSARGQFNPKKIEQDHFLGKVGEFGVYIFLKSLGYRTAEPDTDIYIGRKKSHVDDLIGDISIKVKSCDLKSPYGLSWVFQFAPNPDPIFRGIVDGYAAFCSVGDNSVDIYGIIPTASIVSLLREPIKDSLKPFKRVLYLKELEEHMRLSGKEIEISESPQNLSV